MNKGGRTKIAFLVALKPKASALSAYIAISLLIMLIYILRRRAGYEAKIENGHVSDIELFWVSGVLDGLAAIAAFSALYWPLIFLRRAHLSKASKATENSLSDTFR